MLNPNSPTNFLNDAQKKAVQTVRRLTLPHTSIQRDPLAEKQARLISGLALIVILSSVIGMAAAIFQADTHTFYSLLISFIFALAGYIASRSRYFRIGHLSIMAGFTISGIYLALVEASLSEFTLLSTITFTLIMAYSLLSVREIGFLTLGILILTILLRIIKPVSDVQRIHATIGLFLTWGLLIMILEAHRRAMEKERLREIEKVNQELHNFQESLENRVKERTLELSLAVELGNVLSRVRDRSELIQQAVDLIQERFGLYYVQIYLTDAQNRSLVLQAGSGETGKLLKQQGHRLSIDATSLNGRAVYEKKPIVVPDTTQTSSFRPNPLLPYTRSELCVPLVTQGRIKGVLDIQSDQRGGLSEETLPAFMSLAGQIAIAIENAELYEQQKETAAIIEAQARQLSKAGWSDFLNAIDQPERLCFSYSQGSVQAESPAASDRQNGNFLELPIRISGYPVGAIRLQRAPEESWHEEDKEIVQAVAEQVARQVENLRLLNQAERYRLEAEKITRLMTKEGWQSFLSESFGGEIAYLYDHNQITSVSDPQSLTVEGGLTLREPLKVRGESIGELAVLGIENFSEETKTVLTTIAEQLSAHIENLRLSAQTQEALARTDALYQIGQRLQRGGPFDEVLGDILNTLISTTGADQAMFTGIDDRSGKITSFVEQGSARGISNRNPYNILDGVYRWVVQERKTAYIQGRAQDARENEQEYEYRIKNELGSLIVVPVQSQDRIFGILTLASHADRPDLSQRDVDIAEAVAGQLAITIENRNLLEKTQSLAQRERTLRQITSQVRSYNDPDLILKTAVRELGAAIGRKLMIALDEAGQEGAPHKPPIFKNLPVYCFDHSSVETLADPEAKAWLDQNEGSQSLVTVALKLRGNEPVGKLGIFEDPDNPLTGEEIDFIEQVADQVTLALESARLFMQTQMALEETDALYNIIADLNAARDYKAVLNVLSQRTILKNADQSLLMFAFDHPLGGTTTPEWVIPIAWKSNAELHLAKKYPLSAFEAEPATLFTKSTIVMESVEKDPRLDRVTRTLFEEVFSAGSTIIIPLLLGDRAIGFIMGNFSQTRSFSEGEIKRLSTIANQVAIAVQGMQLLEQTLARAQREQLLRELTSQITSATTTEAVLKRAAEQLGKALRRSTYVYLGEYQPASDNGDQTGDLSSSDTRSHEQLHA